VPSKLGNVKAVVLNHEEAVDSMRQLRPFIEFAKTAGMSGVGFEKECPVCGENGMDIDRQDIIDICLLIGEGPKKTGILWGVPPEKIFWHRQHLFRAFWTYGIGGRVASDGHWLNFPKNGTEEERFNFYRGQFQLLAWRAQRANDPKEVRNNLVQAMACDKALTVLAREPRDMKRALQIPDDQMQRIEEAEEKRRLAMLENFPDATKVRIDDGTGEVR
jgi:hypothetical protein